MFGFYCRGGSDWWATGLLPRQAKAWHNKATSYMSIIWDMNSRPQPELSDH